MNEKLIFVSCGQQTIEEKRLGTSIKDLVNSHPGYKAYFAECVQNLDALARNIFEGLLKCSGLISFLHERGLVTQNNENWGYRSSVWVNQEIAILAYRKHFEGVEIPILVFKDEKVRLEGAMSSLIVNPHPIKSESEVLKEVELWLNSTKFSSSSLANKDRFISKWNKLSPESILVLSALLDEGGINVKEDALRTCLKENYNIKETHNIILNAKSEFIKTDLVKLIYNVHSGDEMSVNPTWEGNLRREISKKDNLELTK